MDKETEYSSRRLLVSYFIDKTCVKHMTWFNFFDANIGNDIAEALNESFTLEELEISEMRS